MVEYIIALVLIGMALASVSLRRTYNFFPVKELKRQARGGDTEAAALYHAVAYGSSLRVILWIVISLGISVAFVLLTRVAPFWIGGIALAGVIWYAFAWAPNRRVGRLGLRLAVAVSPAIAGMLYYSHRPLDWLSRTLAGRGQITFHTGLFEREDLIELVERQKELSDNRIERAELDIVLRALSFGEKTVASIMVPRSHVKTVMPDDSLGPILMDELYASGHSRFPVTDGKEVVGTLFLRDLVKLKQGGMVRNHMQSEVKYLHDGQTLYDVLQAFLHTKYPMYVVIDDKAEYVGIITIEDVIAQIVGHKSAERFDGYDDKQAVIRHVAD